LGFAKPSGIELADITRANSVNFDFPNLLLLYVLSRVRTENRTLFLNAL